jgi:hypothetical protein
MTGGLIDVEDLKPLKSAVLGGVKDDVEDLIPLRSVLGAWEVMLKIRYC